MRPFLELRQRLDLSEFEAAGFRQEKYPQNHEQVGGHGKDCDGAADRHAAAEVADQRGEKRSGASAEVVGEALAGAAEVRGKELGEKGAHGGERARGEESQGKAEEQSDGVIDPDDHVEQDGEEGEGGEEDQGDAAAEAVGEPRAGEIAAEGPGDDDEEIASGVGDRESTRTEVERKEGGDRVVAALRAEGDEGGEQGDAQQMWRKDLEELGA